MKTFKPSAELQRTLSVQLKSKIYKDSNTN